MKDSLVERPHFPAAVLRTKLGLHWELWELGSGRGHGLMFRAAPLWKTYLNSAGRMCALTPALTQGVIYACDFDLSVFNTGNG